MNPVNHYKTFFSVFLSFYRSITWQANMVSKQKAKKKVLPGQGFASKDVTLAHPSRDGEQHFGLLIGLGGIAEVVPEDDCANVIKAQTFLDGLAVADEVVSEKQLFDLSVETLEPKKTVRY